MMRRAWGQRGNRLRLRFILQQVSQRERAETAAGAEEEIAPRMHRFDVRRTVKSIRLHGTIPEDYPPQGAQKSQGKAGVARFGERFPFFFLVSSAKLRVQTNGHPLIRVETYLTDAG